MKEPLEGIVVVEMTIAVQGPAAGLYLRDMGAEVIKVEPPLGDASRYSRGRGNELPEGNMGPQFVAVNRGKRSVCLDVTQTEGLAALHALLAGADVFYTNYRREALAKLALDYDSLKAKYPNLIYGAVNGFGPLGQDADKAMLDGAAVARGGLVNMTGHGNGGPCLPGAIVGDTSGAMHLALGIMTALLARERHGVAQQVQTSALGTQLWLQQWELTHVAMTGADLSRDGAHHPIIKGPYGVYATSDGGAIMLATTMQQEDWDAFCSLAEVPELAIDPRLQTPGQRLGEGLTEADTAEIRATLAAAFKRKTALEWDALLRQLPEVIWERVRTWQEVLSDPQSEVNNYIVEIDVPGYHRTKTVGNLVNLSATPGSTKGGPPELGADNVAVLRAAGLNQTTIEVATEQANARREEMLAQLLAAREEN